MKIIFLLIILFCSSFAKAEQPGGDYFSYSCKALGKEKWLHPAFSGFISGSIYTCFLLSDSRGQSPFTLDEARKISVGFTLILVSIKEVGDWAQGQPFTYGMGDIFIMDLSGAVAVPLLLDLLFPRNSNIELSLSPNKIMIGFKI